MSLAKFKLALIQLSVTSSKTENLRKACALVREAAQKGAKLVALPECFNSPYGTQFFKDYAEPLLGETAKALSSVAKENNVHVIGGSFPEAKDGKLFNTCTVWGPSGDLLAVHRKIHLFDINVPGKICFRESETLTAGDSFTTFKFNDACKVGLGICYDMRFAEMAQLYAKRGCKVLVYPGAFNMTTGPAHWELLQRARAVDNQVYVATVSPARDAAASYIAWGHSSVASPWGEIIATTEENEAIVYADIDLDYLDQVRQQIPIYQQKRLDLYDVVEKLEN